MSTANEQIRYSPREVASIKLCGEPYQQIVGGDNGVEEHVDCSRTLDRLAENTDYFDRVGSLVAEVEPLLSSLFEGGGYYQLDRAIKHGQNLSFEESFSLATFVIASLNKPLRETVAGRVHNLGDQESHILQAVALLSAMSAKEAYAGLTAEEIAGMVAATIHLDTVARIRSSEPIFAFGGMGGDKGYPLNGENSKLFSLSTLGAVALSVDAPVQKHHSYPNTSKVAGQSAIEAYGGRSDFNSLAAMEATLAESGLIMTSCHNTRTLHTLSHRLKGETVNHVIGPLAHTISSETVINGFIGVNEKVHPQVVTSALQILNDRGFQRYGNSVVCCGTDMESLDVGDLDPVGFQSNPELKNHVMIDEVAPPPFATVAAFLVKGENKGTYLITADDFYDESQLSRIRLADLEVPNTYQDIMHANSLALAGHDESKTGYLAMTVGLGIFVRSYLDRPEALDFETRRVNRGYLRQATERARQILKSEKAARQLFHYAEVTKKYAGKTA